MKRLNYYQVHKNKNPKKIKSKKYSVSASKIKGYFKSVDKYLKTMNNICTQLEESYREFSSKRTTELGKIGDEIKMVTIRKPRGCGPTEGIIISIDSGGGAL